MASTSFVSNPHVLPIPLVLLEAKIKPILDKTCDLLKGFYVSRLPAQSGIIHKTYVSYKRAEEERKNQEYRAKLEDAEREFFKRHCPTSRTSEAMRLYEQRKARHLHEIAKELLQTELGNTFMADMQLKVTIDTFQRDRWIQVLFNNTLAESEALVPKNLLYSSPEEEQFHKGILAKIQKLDERVIFPQFLPGICATAAERQRFQEIEKRKEGLMKQALDNERKKILDDTCDFSLIHSNLGYGGLGSARSPYGRFTGEAIDHLKKTVEECYAHYELVKGELHTHKHKKKVSSISADERLLLMMNAFVDSYSCVEWLRYGALEQIATKILNNEATPAREPLALSPEEALREQMKKERNEVEKQLKEIKSSVFLSKTSSLKKEQLTILDTFATAFFKEVKRAHTALDDLLCLVEIHLDKDFTEEEREKAKSVSKSIPIPQLAPPPLSTSPGRLSALLSTPGRKNTNSSKGTIEQFLHAETPRGSRKISTPFSPRNLIAEARVEDYRVLKLFHKVIKNPLKLLASIIKASEKR